MKENEQPISFLVPIRNGLTYLNRFKTIINNNIGQQDEVVIIDDGSTDGTSDFLKTWAEEQDNVRLLKTSGVGLVQALNLGLSQSANRWIARFDVDDEYEPNRIAAQRNLIKSGTVAIFSDYEFIDELNVRYGSMSSPIFPNPTAVSLANSSRTAHPSALYDKEAVVESGGYLEADYPAEDLALWLRLINYGDIVSVPELLLHYRLRKNSISLQHRGNSIFKKQELVSKAFHLKSNFHYCLENFDAIISSYNKLPLSNQRKILFVRDLLSVTDNLKLQMKYRSYIMRKTTKLLLNPAMIFEVTALNLNKLRRQKLRSSLKD
jgi:glycosyltransferase involved in cell wall biosynthesis